LRQVIDCGPDPNMPASDRERPASKTHQLAIEAFRDDYVERIVLCRSVIMMISPLDRLCRTRKSN